MIKNYLDIYVESWELVVVVGNIKDETQIDELKKLWVNIIVIDSIYWLNWINQRIWNIILVDEKWPFKNENWTLIGVIPYNNRILEWWESTREKIDAIMDSWAERISLVDEEWIFSELSTIEWAWSMIINESKLSFEKINNVWLFEMIYRKNVSLWYWKDRSEEEKINICKNYYVLKIWTSVLWWYQLVKFDDNWWVLIQCLWSPRQKSWMWKKIIEHIKLSNNWFVYAYSKEKDFFIKMWFEAVEWKFSESWALLYVWKWY